MTNEKNFTPELLEKAKSATSAAALSAFAQENDITLTAEEAALYFAQLHPKEGALSDEELDNVSGGCGESEAGKALALEYAQKKYCGKGPRCVAQQKKNAKEASFYLAIPAREQKICSCCRCKSSIDSHCESMQWPKLERSYTQYTP